MSKTIWQKPAAIGALAMGMTMMAGSAHATYSHDCSGGGGSNPDCYTWTFDSQSDVYNGVKGTPVGNPAVTATVKGWSNTGDLGTAGNVLIETAYVGSYSSNGMGVTNNDESGSNNNHTVDNSNYRADSITFSFSEAVNLSSFNAGYVYTDSDFTVLAYIGDDGALNDNDPTGQTYGDLLLHGWKLIGNYTAGSSTGAHNFANFNNGSTATNNIFSSLWMIGAYNTFVGGDPTKAGNDYFKLLSVAGCDCTTAPPGTPGCGGGCIPGTPGCGGGVPEPGTLLLMAIGLLGLTYHNKQRAQAQV